MVGLDFFRQFRKVLCAAYAVVRCWDRAGSEAEQSLECRHGLLSPVMTKNELVQIDLQLVATHAVIRADDPALEGGEVAFDRIAVRIPANVFVD